MRASAARPDGALNGALGPFLDTIGAHDDARGFFRGRDDAVAQN